MVNPDYELKWTPKLDQQTGRKIRSVYEISFQRQLAHKGYNVIASLFHWWTQNLNSGFTEGMEL